MTVRSLILTGNGKIFILQRDHDIVCYPETTSFILRSPISDNPECMIQREEWRGYRNDRQVHAQQAC